MKQNKLFLGLATLFAATFTFAACSSDDAETQNAQQAGQKINFVYKSAAGTRTAEDPQSGTSVKTGINVGIFGVSSEATTTMTNNTNTKYQTASGNALSYAGTEGNEMTWPTAVSATASIYAYAPYQEGWTVDAANTFTVGADQSDDTKYLASDLLYASATDQPNGSTVALTFGHKLAKVNVTITKAEGSTTNLTGAKIYITGTKLAATFTPSTGAVTVDGTASASDILALTIGSDLTAGDANSKATACAVVVPQDLAAETAFIKIVTSDSKTLIGKLSSAATLASNGTYSMNISVGNVTEAETIVKVSFGTTSLVEWGADTPIGLTAYGVGDYVLKDGTIVKHDDLTDTQKTNVIAVIFSTTVSTTDATEGYNAYAMGVSRIGASGGTKKQWYVNTSYSLGAANLADGFADLDGLSKTTQIKGSSTYTALETKTEHIANLDNYSLAIDAGAIVGSETEGNRNLSGWFTPSFGQLIAIFNNLGEAGITSGIAKEFRNNSSFYVNSDNSTWANTEQGGITISTVLDKINAYTTAAGKGNILALGTVDLGTVTENTSGSANGEKFWMFALKSSGDWELTAAQAKVSQNSGVKEVCVIPCVAVKLPAVAQ